MPADPPAEPDPARDGMAAGGSLTALLSLAHAGDRAAAEDAYRLVYQELRKIAHARLRAHAPHTLLDTQALVHESFLHLMHGQAVAFDSRKHFYAYAAKAMRNIVIDHARRRHAQRHGGDLQRVTLATNAAIDGGEASSVIEIDHALGALEALDPVLAHVVEMRYFGGYGDADIAAALGVSERTVRRYWDKARAFMLVQLRG